MSKSKNEAIQKPKSDVIQEYELPVSKKTVQMFAAKGWHFERAMTQAKGNQSRLMAFMAAETSTFDGEKVTGFDVSEFALKDYLEVLTQTAKAFDLEGSNFT